MKNSQEIIDNLSPADALSILKTLAANDDQLANRIAQIALEHLSQVGQEEVAALVYDGLNFLEVEEVWDRAGSTRQGYVEPGEAADQMIDEVLEPFLADMKKYQQLGLSVQARQLCMGLLAGLCRFDDESTSQFKEWAAGAPAVFTEAVIDAWQEGKPSRADRKAVRAFMEEELGIWNSRLI
jgi:hypothetical protein